ncbi:MAG: hypothetical protein ACD_30C00112G0037 [uncultured bacterium]|uniref:Uncharacterized protein n=4 Tax=Candidatus Daviesiibacteriota TaxID=1752718 RepID=A0A0G0EUE5_9BACT|nr:MAG: hypothetical protein ACD_30C00112G0037 [uncultured bacterium]KKQ10543.1 MAG: hypothetical protein US19_C0003G0038 [Candidatus Daviesbacteria bacterium GW2011_GWB1_36_5]KKQ15286.1 MAG: hypothetical protein US28_C0019G0019 [Candidatus Daviesbacteria bacterium GW2011_GWA1_36_8]OGE17196.1 MAG: hypothetical protein A2858_00635 [Candidatus Daviesbacteria bacterium RIFCSPHIGHO2_01_FULL_36_37]OGE35977.1 MAG: hypothetical protein A3E66_01630 [Candidatus Daviesbacteria bacterium RIFCSPHIGHO2_12_F
MPGKKLSAISYQLSDSRQKESDDFSTGFTLIEILVAISIVVIVSAVALPNLRNFSNDQDLDNKISELKNILRKGQSSSNSSALCSNNSASTSFYVSISSSSATLYSTCASGPLNTLNSLEFNPPIVLSQTSCAFTDLPAVVTFTNTQTAFTCNTTPLNQPNLSITLLNQSSGASKVISILKGGVISDN